MKADDGQLEEYRRMGATVGRSAAEVMDPTTRKQAMANGQAALESSQVAPNRSKRPKGKVNQETEKMRQKAFQALCVANGLPKPEYEFYFALSRKWRFDWSWPNCVRGHGGVALEIEGGIFAGKTCPTCKRKMGGRHNSGKGFLDDLEKYNRATIIGWRVLRCTPQMVESGEVFKLLKEVMG